MNLVEGGISNVYNSRNAGIWPWLFINQGCLKIISSVSLFLGLLTRMSRIKSLAWSEIPVTFFAPSGKSN